MEQFAFLVHPLDINDVAKKYRLATKVSPKVVASILRRRRPFVIAEIEGIRSLTGVQAVGWFIAVPLLPWQLLQLEEEYVLEKLAKAVKVAKKQGAKIVGLGAYTAIPGNGGQKLAQLVDLPITTGNTYTTATAIDSTLLACQEMEIKPEKAVLAVVGATGSIGQACATILAPRFQKVILVGRDFEKLNQLQKAIQELNPQTQATTNIKEIKKAEVVITVTSAVSAIIQPEDLKSGAVVCDVARPRDVSAIVSQVRDDVLVIDGGIVKPPGEVNFNLDFGPPPGLCEGCIGETIILALEKRYESYTLGKNITLEMVKEMNELAAKHGFSLAGLRRFEKMLTKEEIEAVKQRALAKT